MSKRREGLHDRTAADAFISAHYGLNGDKGSISVQHGDHTTTANIVARKLGIATDGYQHGGDCACHK